MKRRLDGVRPRATRCSHLLPTALLVTLLMLGAAASSVEATDPIFKAGWNDPENNDAGNGGAGGLNQAQITQCLRNYSTDLDKAIDCGFLEVSKGCHQLADPHITIDGHGNRNVSKKCKDNLYFESNSVHIPCGGC